MLLHPKPCLLNRDYSKIKNTIRTNGLIINIFLRED